MKILSITSGKGGVGKSTVSLNIARQLSKNSIKTLIVDFDIHNKGLTSLFLEKLDDGVQSTISIVQESNQFDVSMIPEMVDKIQIISLDEDGSLFFVPASAPKQLIQWSYFVSDNHNIVNYFHHFFKIFAAKYKFEAVIIDCYGGIDSLTVAATGIADDTIIINEPDVITFSGTLLLYNYLSDVYSKTAKKPHIHFVINRITSRHSFKFLSNEYKKHLAGLAIRRSILSYLPYDKLLFENFGDYPFFTELLPKSLITKKLQLLIVELFREEKFQKLFDFSENQKKKIYKKVTETPYADPERILKVSVTAPLWLIIPVTILIFLNQGIGNSLHYNTIRWAYLFSVGLISIILLVVGVFEPFQITRWLLHTAKFHSMKRYLQKKSNKIIAKIISALEWIRALLPAFISLIFAFLLLSVAATIFDNPYFFRDVRIWPGEIYGFSSGKYYKGLHMKPGSSIKSGSIIQNADLSFAVLRKVYLSGVDFSYSHIKSAEFNSSKLEEANLSHSDLTDSSLPRAVLRNAQLIKTNLQNASLWGADLTDANLEYANLNNADLSQSLLKNVNFKNTDLSNANIDGANLTGADITGNESISERNLSYAWAAGAKLDIAQIQRALNWENKQKDPLPWLEGFIYEYGKQAEQVREKLDQILNDL